jgi:hypothetical protein
MRGYQVQIEMPVTRKVGGKWTTGPVRLVRKNKPAKGGATVAEFSNENGDGVQQAQDFVKQRGLTLVGMK